MNNIDLVAAKAGIWYTLANIILKGCIFISLPIFTRILSPSDFGIYNTYIAYEGILTAILGLGLYGTVKKAKFDFKDRFDEYLSSALSINFSLLLIFLFLANGLYGVLGKKLEFNRLMINCLIFQSFGSFLLFFYSSKLNIEFRYKSYIRISSFNTIGNIILSILLILFVFPNERYIGRILGSATPLIIIGSFILINIFFKGRKIYSHEYWKYAITIEFPLIPHVLSQSLLSQFDRIMISKMVGSEASGIYSYIYTICTILYVVCSSVDNSWTSWVYIKLEKGEQEDVKKASKNYISFFSIITLGFICIIPEITKLISDKSYWSGLDILIPLSLANFFIFLYMMPVNIEYYNKRTKYISVGTVSAVVVNLLLNLITIARLGYKAAAYTTLISYILLFVFHCQIAQKYRFREIYDLKHILVVTAKMIGLALLIAVMDNFRLISIILRYVITVILIIRLWKYRKIATNLLLRKG